ncbi:MAG: ornithine carbamoyltransferase [Verrucomicrobiales bacterium]
MKNLLSIEQLNAEEIEEIVALGARMKSERGKASAAGARPLAGQTWAMIFTKASTRTRVSFEVGVRELGGDVFFLNPNDAQLGRGEPIKDTARVFGRIAHGAIIRTFSQGDVEEFAHYSGLPTINALTDEEHPCQVLSDLLTLQECAGGWAGKRVVFLGDGNNNMARSWMWAAERLRFDLVIAAPPDYQPSERFLAALKSGCIRCEADPVAAVQGAHVLYTDVFVSMGQEAESEDRWRNLKEYQINSELLAHALSGALVMHCLPAYRGKEITEEVLEAHAGTIFQQAENRLHAQKAVMTLVAQLPRPWQRHSCR